MTSTSRRCIRILVLSALCCAGAPTSVSAESITKARALPEGERNRWLTGNVRATAGDTIVVLASPYRGLDTLHVRQLGALEVSLGRKVRAQNMFAGALFGTVFGAVVVLFIGCGGGACEGSSGGYAPVGALAWGAVIGGPIGLAVGCILVESWERVYTSEAATRSNRDAWR